MLLESVAITDGDRAGRVRVQGRVRYDGDGLEEVLWFDLPASEASHLSTTGNPWLVLLLPLAVTLREPLRIALPVDPVLLEGGRAVLDVWSSWYPDLTPVAVEAPSAPAAANDAPTGTGLLFSGGVDSFFSLIRHNGPASTGAYVPVTDLLLLHGADIPLSDTDAFTRLRPRIAEVAREFGIRLVDIATNARETRWRRADWGHLSHGALLAASGLLLEPRLARLLIASSASYPRLEPYGSHPLTDPLFSTSRTRVIHDGADQERPAKTLAIATHPVVLQHLRVCWIGKTDSNCGRCPKCLNTMLGLELAGMLRECRTLPNTIDPSIHGKVYYNSQGTYHSYAMARVFRQSAMMSGRKDLVRFLDRVLARSDRLRFAKEVLEGLARRHVIPAALSSRMVARLFRSSVKY